VKQVNKALTNYVRDKCDPDVPATDKEPPNLKAISENGAPEEMIKVMSENSKVFSVWIANSLE
jgi:hypothetical protein